MTDLITMPENYENIRTGIVELLKAARSAAGPQRQFDHDREIGRRIVEQEMKGESRANYGEQLMALLAKDLTRVFGRGFGQINLWRMRTFYRAWSEGQILSALSKELCKQLSSNNLQPSSLSISDISTSFPLPWSAYVRLLAVKRPEDGG